MRFGMRHVSWVSITIDHGCAHAELHGIGHRLPRAVAIPMSTAAALAADGVPTRVHRVEASGPATTVVG